MRDAVVVSAVRTAIGKMGGTLMDIPPEELARVVIEESLKRAGVEKGQVNEVVFGQTKQSADAANLARVAALMAKIPVEVPAYTVMRQCGSGLQAINNAVQSIWSGVADIVVAGGTESMSNAPFYLRNARYGYKAGNAILVDSNTESQPRSQPVEIYGHLTMGMTAENLAEIYKIRREEQDEFALNSQEKALAAISQGKFKEEIVPVQVMRGKGSQMIFDQDEHPRRLSMAQLAKLEPVFKENGTVTAGNSSGRNDGATAVVVMSSAAAKKMNIKPLAVIRSQAVAGVSPEIMGIAPAPATLKALKLASLCLSDIGLVELNEAFAAQALAVIKNLGLNPGIVNVNGGAIALGHPLGCSGARIFTTLIYEMRRRNVKYGLAAICIAGGQGIATIIELID